MKRKSLITTVLAATLTLSSAFSSFAGQWMQDNVGWWWQEDDGSYPKDSWKWLDGNGDGVFEQYHFNANGYLDVNMDLKAEDGRNARVDANGAMSYGTTGIIERRVNGAGADKQTKLMFIGTEDNFTKYLTIHDNSEYMSEYTDLQPGVAFVYSFENDPDNAGYYIVIAINYELMFKEYNYWYKTIKNTDNYQETNIYADQNGNILCGKICIYDNEADSYVRIFGYY